MDLYNKETGIKIANEPEELPPLREGYIRLKHMTNFSNAQSLAENGLVYNEEYAQNFNKDNTKQKIYTSYLSIDSMANGFDEEDFWNSLTSETGIRHRGSDAVAIFDMPIKEFMAHINENISQFLSGTISAGYMVGMIPNYGTRDMSGFERLTEEEMQKRKKQSLANPLPPDWETPHWQEDVAEARNKLKSDVDDKEFAQVKENIDLPSSSESAQTEADWFETQFADLSPDSEVKSATVEVYNGENEEFDFGVWKFDDNNNSHTNNKDERRSNDESIRDKAMQKMQAREQARNEHTDYLQDKLNNLRRKLGIDDESKYKTAMEVNDIIGVENQTCKNGVIKGKYKKGPKLHPNDYIGEIHIQAMCESMQSRKR